MAEIARHARHGQELGQQPARAASQLRAGRTLRSLGDEKRAGDYGLVEVIRGGCILRRVYFRADGELIGELYNIQTPTELEPGIVRYTDLEVDVVRRGHGRVEVVDVAELQEAVEMGGVSQELADKALAIADSLARKLEEGGDWRDADAPYRECCNAAAI